MPRTVLSPWSLPAATTRPRRTRRSSSRLCCRSAGSRASVGSTPARTCTSLASGASFAAFCGVIPTEASCGRSHRHRLSRSGDPQVNSALYTITIACLRGNRQTQDCVRRRGSEGYTRREAIRCLERHVSRHLC
ncbi:transposase [Pseudonocardia sp. Ae717_Ps2]|uniref:transposase n=1 Tax=unclassified Pseudonocardia TaxID=2619320 RepID=UPI00094AE519